MRSDLTLGGALTALSALGYATNPILGKFAYAAGATPVVLMTIRFSVAAMALWVVIGLRRGSAAVPAVRRLQLVVLGVVGLVAVSLLYFTAVQNIDASLATGLFYTYPAQVALVGLIRGEGISRWGWLGLAATAAGTWLLLGHLGGFTWQGVLLIMLSSVFYTAYILISGHLTRGIAPDVATAYISSGAAAVYLVAALVMHQTVPNFTVLLMGSGLAAFSTILALVAFFAGMAKIGPTRAAIISTLEPVFTAILAGVLLHEHLTGLQTLGMALVVAGAVFAQQRDRSEGVSAQA